MTKESFISTALTFQDGRLSLLDQTRLPHEEVWLTMDRLDQMVEAIRTLRVRGAPLIGVTAGLFLAKLASDGLGREGVVEAAAALRGARPTAVNLMAVVDRCLLASDLVDEAFHIAREDQLLCERIGGYGAAVIPDGANVITICNAGALATAGIGTALGVFTRAWKEGKRFHVFVPETRPLGQGARLTAWELKRLGIPHTLICDNMVGWTMKTKGIRVAVVGADRIATNGDFANKIGTYNMAHLAKAHGVELYVAAPYTTVDHDCATGEDIPIEERGADEVRGTHAPRDCAVFNPAFDVTPAALVTAYILDHGLVASGKSLRRAAK